VYSRAVVGFGGSSRSRNRNTIVDLPYAHTHTQYITVNQSICFLPSHITFIAHDHW